jgi:hypothetical protein
MKTECINLVEFEIEIEIEITDKHKDNLQKS